MTLYHVILWLTYRTIRFIENPLKPLTWVYGGEIWIALLGTDKPHSTGGPGGGILSLIKQSLPGMTVAHRKLRVTTRLSQQWFHPYEYLILRLASVLTSIVVTVTVTVFEGSL